MCVYIYIYIVGMFSSISISSINATHINIIGSIIVGVVIAMIVITASCHVYCRGW